MQSETNKAQGVIRIGSISPEGKVILYSVAICLLLIGGYIIHPIFAFLAYGCLLVKTIFTKEINDTLIPLFIIVSWGAEIWQPIGVQMYTLLRLIALGTYYCKCLFAKRLGKTSVWIAIVFFAFYMLIGDLFSGGNNITTVVNLTLTYGAIYLAVRNSSGSDFSKLALAFATGVALSAFISLISSINPRLNSVVSSMIMTYNTYGINKLMRLSGLTYDPNLFGFYVMFSLCSLLRVFFQKSFKNTPILILILILVPLGLMTLSKSYLIIFGCLLLVFAYQWMGLKSVSSSRKTLITASLIILGIVAFVQLAPYMDAFIERFSVASVGELTTGRSDVWKRYLMIFLEDPLTLLVGRGLGGALKNASTPHNFIIFMLYFFGLFGAVLHFLMISQINLQVKKNHLRKQNVHFMYIPLLFYFMYIMTIDPFKLYDIKLAMLIVGFLAIRSAYVSNENKCSDPGV